MISSELRIGNYVASTNFIYIIKEVAEKYVRIKGIDLDYDYNYPLCEITNLKPIPLTEEYLIRFGFGGTREYYYDTEIGAIEFYFEDEILVCDIYDSRNKNIKYVHQLQNLYFALTGKELIIK